LPGTSAMTARARTARIDILPILLSKFLALEAVSGLRQFAIPAFGSFTLQLSLGFVEVGGFQRKTSGLRYPARAWCLGI
jgi:hypothetical protein